MRSDDLRVQSPSGLLIEYAQILHLLRLRGVVRSFNNPIADIAEWIVSKKLDLTRAPPGTKGYDATDGQGKKYQIKARWHSGRRYPSQFGPLRDIPSRPFDFLVAVVFDGDFLVDQAVIIPVEVVERQGTPTGKSDPKRLNLSAGMLMEEGVRNITAELQTFPPTEEEERFLGRVGALKLGKA